MSFFRVSFNSIKTLFVAEPELIKQVLVKDFHKFINRFSFKFNHPTWDHMLFMANGEDWKRLRVISSPTFTSGKMKKMYSTVHECIKLLDEAITEKATSCGEVNLKEVFGNLTMDVICRCAFGIKTNTHNDPNNAFVKNSLRFFNMTWRDKLRAALFMTIPPLRKLGLSIFNPEPLSKFREMIRAIIVKRESQVQQRNKPNDYLQLMLDSRNQTIEGDDQVDSIDSAGIKYEIKFVKT